jgi:hypothetical protein
LNNKIKNNKKAVSNDANFEMNDLKSSLIYKNFGVICSFVEMFARTSTKNKKEFENISDEDTEVFVKGMRHGIANSVAAIDMVLFKGKSLNEGNLKIILELKKRPAKKKKPFKK